MINSHHELHQSIFNLDMPFHYKVDKVGNVLLVINKTFTRANLIKETFFYNLKIHFSRKLSDDI